MLPAVEISDSLSVGEALVAGGTLALAVFTWRLAKTTAVLDERNASRERKRHERKVRGVARLIDGELQVVDMSLNLALEGNKWQWHYPTPHATWDRDGALIAETVPEDVAVTLIELYAQLCSWESVIDWTHKQHPDATELGLDPYHPTIISILRTRVDGARRGLELLAYPDARDIERQPDRLLENRRERPAWLRKVDRLFPWRKR